MVAVSRGPETLIVPFRGREQAVSDALDALGLSFPAQNTCVTSGDAALLWAGRGRALLTGVAAPDGLASDAALVSQTGARAVVLLSGPAMPDVLARLVPVDLRDGAFPVGAVALTLVGHMTAALRRTPAGIEVAVMRSMAQTLVEEVTRAARNAAARATLD